MRVAPVRIEALEDRYLLSAGTTQTAVLRPDHVVVVIEQDRTNAAVGDTVHMPYFNQLASTGLVYTNYHGAGHPSEPNSLTLYSGSTQGITDNGYNWTFSGPNLAKSLNSTLVSPGNYLSFAGYAESLPQDGDMTTTIASDPNDPTSPPDLYGRIYNPMAQFTDVGQHGGTAISPAQVNRTFASFPTTASGYASLPTVAYVIPNSLHSSHGSNLQPPYSTDPVQYDFLRTSADTWLQSNLSGYLGWARTHNSLLIVVTDEEETDTHPSTAVTMIVNGDPRLFATGENSHYLNHYNLVRTIEDMYALAPLGDTATAAGLDVNAQGQLAATAAGTTTTLASSSPSSLQGQSVTFTATVTPDAANPATPTGTVTFKDGTSILGSGTLNASGQTTLTISTLGTGSHSITAVYGGDAQFAASTSLIVSQTVTPANDDFANRTTLSGTVVTSTGTNVGATKQTGEPNHAGNVGGKSVWWTWAAPGSGMVTIDTIGSSFDTTLGVYTGSSVSALTLIKGDDDGGGNHASKLTFGAVGGTSYQIAVDGYDGASGSITLNLAAAPMSLQISGDQGSAGQNDQIRLARDLADPSLLDVFLNSLTPTYSANFAAINTIVINGLGGDDTLTLDLANGPVIPTGGISYDGGAQTNGDSLIIAGSSGDDTVTFASGQVTIGSGVVTLTGVENRSFKGGAGNDSLTLGAGSYTFASDLALDTTHLNLSLADGAQVAFSGVQHLAGLALSGDSKVTLADGGQSTLVVQGLSVGAASTLDVADNAVIVDYTGSNPFAAIYSLVATSAANRWAGNGIASHTAAGGGSQYALGTADNTIANLANFAGQSVDATSVLLRFTYSGDANLDGQVDLTDLSILAGSWQMAGRQWGQGDFDYSGLVDLTDLSLLAGNWQKVLPTPLAAPAAAILTQTNVSPLMTMPSSTAVDVSEVDDGPSARSTPSSAAAVPQAQTKLPKKSARLAVAGQHPARR